MVIPKKIHYCWFGSAPLPDLAVKCIRSWQEFLPDFQIIEWNEKNFDVNINDYTREAFKEKKYAFVSDYARFWILYQFGGVYFDTDVELIRPLYEILEQGPFMGCEHDGGANSEIAVAPGLGLAGTPNHPIFKQVLDFYDTLHFSVNGKLNLTTVVHYTTAILKRNGLKNVEHLQQVGGINIFPKEFFCPKSFETGEMMMTKNTYSIHHFAASWRPRFNFNFWMAKILGGRITKFIQKILKR